MCVSPRFRSSHLPNWVEEKSEGRHTARETLSLTLGMIRTGGPAAVASALRALPNGGRGAVIVANALEPTDMDVVALGCMQVRHRSLIDPALQTAAPSATLTGPRDTAAPAPICLHSHP